MKIEAGKKYVTRGGKVAGVTTMVKGFHAFIEDESIWTTDSDGIAPKGREEYDLVSEYVEPEACPHAALMLEYAKDAQTHARPWELWEYSGDDGLFYGTSAHPIWHPVCQYRRKPRTIKVNGVDVPAPETTAPAEKTLVYVPAPDVAAYVRWTDWTGNETQREWLARGLVHLTQESAAAHGKAMCQFQKEN